MIRAGGGGHGGMMQPVIVTPAPISALGPVMPSPATSGVGMGVSVLRLPSIAITRILTATAVVVGIVFHDLAANHDSARDCRGILFLLALLYTALICRAVRHFDQQVDRVCPLDRFDIHWLAKGGRRRRVFRRNFLCDCRSYIGPN